MKILVDRFITDGESTGSIVSIDGSQICMGLEDEPRETKVAGETCIPTGVYKIGLRTVGGFHAKYLKRFPEFHQGMLQVMDVPGFEYILIHIGNTDDDTAGCLLLGEDLYTDHGNMRLVRSTAAYQSFYKKVITAALADDLSIEYINSYQEAKQ